MTVNQTNNPRTRYFDILAMLQKHSHVDPGVFAELLGIKVEESRTKLVRATDNDIFRLQGEAQALERLLRDITSPTPTQESM